MASRNEIAELLKGAIRQVIAMRPVACRYLEEIERHDRPAPNVEQLAGYIEEQFNQGRFRLPARIGQDLRAASQSDVTEACAEYANSIIGGLLIGAGC